jgi:hypothetical protein
VPVCRAQRKIEQLRLGDVDPVDDGDVGKRIDPLMSDPGRAEVNRSVLSLLARKDAPPDALGRAFEDDRDDFAARVCVFESTW